MPLSGRDLLLIITAQDRASSTITRIAGSFGSVDKATAQAAANTLRHGVALTALGVGLVAVGKQGIDILNGWRDAAVDYQQTAALTLTQIDQTGVSLEQVKNIGRDVARAIPAPFEEMQTALYDIFSSIDVNTMQAQMLLDRFSKGAVAGQTDVQTSTRGSIAIMNAFKIPISEVNRVMDVQFELVKKGSGTYKEFADVIGRVAPSAVRMGQTIETASGMLAFLTRNGLTTAQASTSAARALDTLSKVKVQERLEAMGIAVRTATGDYRPLVDIVGDMNNKFKDLTKPELSARLEDLFFGAGNTVAARRFFDTVFQNFDQFKGFVGDMEGSAGAMNKAYQLMFDQPASKMQLFKNKLAILRTELGDRLVPAFTKLVDAGNKVLSWFDKLSPQTKDMIVKFIAFASVAFIVVGAVFTLIGVFLIVQSVLTLAAVSFTTVMLAAGGIILVIAAVAAAGYLIYKNWDTLGPIFKRAFETLKEWAQVAWDKIKEFAAWVMTWLPGVWEDFKEKAGEAWKTIQDFADWVMTWLPGMWEDVKRVAGEAWQVIQEKAKEAWEVIKVIVNWLVENIPPAWENLKEGAGIAWDFIKDKVGAFWDWLQEHVFPVVSSFVEMVRAGMHDIVIAFGWFNTEVLPIIQYVFGIIGGILSIAFEIWKGLFEIFSNVIQAIWRPLWTFVQEYVMAIFNMVKGVIEGALKVIKGIFDFFSALFRGDWGAMWDAILTILSGAWQIIHSVLKGAWDVVFAIVRGAMNLIWQIIQAGWDGILNFFRTVPGKAVSALSSLAGSLADVGWRALNAMNDAIQRAAGSVISFLASLPGKMVSAIGAVGSTMYEVGLRIVEGLINGIKHMAGAAASAAGDVVKGAINTAKNMLHMNSPSKVFDDIGMNTIMGLVQGFRRNAPKVDDAVAAMAKRMAQTSVTVPVGWDLEAGRPSNTATASVNFQGATFNIEIKIDGEGLSAEEIADELDEKLKEFFRELMTGVRP